MFVTGHLLVAKNELYYGYMMLLPTKAQKALMIFGMIAFLSLGFFGMSHSSMAMGPDGNMTMSNCPFMSGQAVVCNMNPLEHIAAWQSMFTTIPQQDTVAIILMLLAALAMTLLWTHLRRPSIGSTYAPTQLFIRSDYIPLATPLQELFSNGILNPKLF